MKNIDCIGASLLAWCKKWARDCTLVTFGIKNFGDVVSGDSILKFACVDWSIKLRLNSVQENSGVLLQVSTDILQEKIIVSLSINFGNKSLSSLNIVFFVNSNKELGDGAILPRLFQEINSCWKNWFVHEIFWKLILCVSLPFRNDSRRNHILCQRVHLHQNNVEENLVLKNSREERVVLNILVSERINKNPVN